MRLRRVCKAGLLVVIAVAISGCQKSTIAPTAPPLTETFAGTVFQEGSVAHPFTVANDGPVSITVVGVSRELPPPPDIPPDPSSPAGIEDQPPPAIAAPIYIGLGIGTWNGSACRVIAQRTNASFFTTMTGSALAGPFCISVFDSGSVTDPVDYVIQVDHT